MKKANRDDKQEAEASGRAKSPITRQMDAYKALQAWNQALAKLMAVPDDDFIGVNVVQKPDVFLAIGKRYWETEQEFVCFAEGDCMATALNALASKWYARDAWKVNKPFKPRE